jgi:phosphoserine aminotransferase
MAKIYNFGAGPSMLPSAVLQRAQEELPDWHGAGISVLEMGHRSPVYTAIAEKAEADFRELLDVPADYRILFLQGGATGQFSAVPLNLKGDKAKTAYLLTGVWSEKAAAEALRYGEVHVVATGRAESYTRIPLPEQWRLDADAAYVHYTANETIGGVEFQHIPDVGALTLVSDMSSNILSRPVDVSRFGLIYAGAQKNIGPAGITVVIVREDLLGRANSITPSVFDYTKQADNASMLNTPPTYNWYLLGLVLEWLKEQGGIAALEQINIRKSTKLYAAIDGSSLYSNPIDLACRSRMNVPFRIADTKLEERFLKDSVREGLINLEGHRSVGDFRASIYNAMPEEGVDVLIEFMREFERRYG